MRFPFRQPFPAAIALFLAAFPAQAQRSVPFDANNGDRPWGVIAGFKGRVTPTAIGLEVSVENCTLQRPKSFTTPEELVYIDVSVTRPQTDGQWNRLKLGSRYQLDQTLSPGQKIATAPFVLEIPLVDFEIQRGDYLTFGIVSKTTRDGKTQSGSIYTQVHVNLPAPTTGPLSRDEIDSTLRGDAGKALIASAIARRGVQFPLTLETVNELSGPASDDTIRDAFRSLQPGAPPKPPAGETAEARQLGDEADALWNGKNYAAAKEKAESGAQAGSSAAMIVLGRLYETGNGVLKDDSAALQWFRRAADAGSPRGMNDLANAYMNGRGVARDLNEGLRLWRLAVDAGDPAAMYNLANAYENARGVNQDSFIAFQFFRRSAESNYPNGMNSLGLAYLNGRGTDRNYDSALRWFRKAADAGVPAAKYNIGLLYETGRGAQTDAAEAARWYRLAADDGYPAAMLKLAHLYETGTGIPKDPAQAEHFYSAATDAGNAQAMVDWGVLLQRDHTETDRAFQLFERSAKYGNPAGLYRLAVAYQSGRGTTADDSLANEYLVKAAEAGSFDAVRMLAGRTRPGSPASQPAWQAGSGDEAVKVSHPEVLYKTDPGYSDEARKLGVEGLVTIAATIGESGRILDLYVQKTLGFGLDEKAIQALLKWKFKPAMRGATPVRFGSRIDFNFSTGAAPGWKPVLMGFEREDGRLPPLFNSGTWERNNETVNGSATLEFTVDKSGQPQNVAVLQSSDPPAAARIARAIAAWRFTPAEKDGAPIEVKGRVRFESGKGGAAGGPLFPPPPPLTLSELRLLIDGGLSEEKLIASIHSRGAGFDLSGDDADSLRKAGAGTAVIDAIRANHKSAAPESK